MIGEHRNFDDVYFRMVGVALVKTLNRCISWINYFDDQKNRVIVPFYMSVAGSDKFVLDAFVDDIVDSRIELNTDQIPRGIVSFNGFSTKSNEFANPNQYISKKTIMDGEMKNFVMRTKGIPIDINYDIDIVLMTEIDVMKASEKIINMLFNWMFFNIDYYGLKLDCSFNLPDDKSIEIVREQNLDSDVKKHIKFSLVVSTYYPSFFHDTDQFIVCDNDDDINWDRVCFMRPSLKDKSELESIKPVYWKSWIWDKDKLNDEKPDGKDRLNLPPENF
ncbi:MAG: hypothetical protein WDA02_07320 [Saccharofermentanales bacterium]